MKHIAIVRTCAVGDAVQCTPLLQQVRADEPDAKITFFTGSNVTSLFDGAPFVDDIVALDPQWLTISAGRRGMARAWGHIARHANVDVLVSLEPTWMRNLGSLLVRSPVKAGLSFTGRIKPFELFTHPLRITGDSRQTVTHASKQYLNLWLGITGGTDRGFGYDMRHLCDQKQNRTDESTICIAPGTGNNFNRQATKQWPIHSFIELGERLLADGWRVAYLGGADDLGRSSVPNGASDLLGKTTLREVAGILCTSSILVGNDSGLFHLAQAVDCPAVGIFGPTSPMFTGVFRAPRAVSLQAALPCMPCYRDSCDFDSDLPKPCCMTTVSVGQVIRSIAEMRRENFELKALS